MQLRDWTGNLETYVVHKDGASRPRLVVNCEVQSAWQEWSMPRDAQIFQQQGSDTLQWLHGQSLQKQHQVLTNDLSQLPTMEDLNGKVAAE
eukprot:7717315-Lingulodinium_polyedra.AAC.1